MSLAAVKRPALRPLAALLWHHRGVLMSTGLVPMLKLRTRSGKVVTVEPREARKTFHSVVPILDGALLVRGDYDHDGVLHARSILRAKNLPALWGQDS